MVEQLEEGGEGERGGGNAACTFEAAEGECGSEDSGRRDGGDYRIEGKEGNGGQDVDNAGEGEVDGEQAGRGRDDRPATVGSQSKTFFSVL